MEIRRYLTSGVGAFTVTLGLGLVMTALIKLPYQEQVEKSERLVYEINPIVEDVAVIRNVNRPELKVVIPPPPAPVLSTRHVDVPIEDFVDFGKQIPPIGRPDIKLSTAQFSIDQVGGPVVRVPPIMPTRATRSGHCAMVFDVNANGITYNVRAASCTQQLFMAASIKSVQKWKYRASINNGHSAGFTGVKTTITFILNDDQGNKISE